MRPSFSPSDAGLFAGVLARGEVPREVDDLAWLQAMLDTEAALARAGAAAGIVAPGAVAGIEIACANASSYDLAALGLAAAAAGNPVVPLVRELERRAGPDVHRGATSQDILDTAMMLVASRALVPLLADLEAAAHAAGVLAGAHRDTVLAGRTLGQQAVPTTFGLKAAGWLTGLDGAADRLTAVRAGLPVQHGGAVGTLAASGGRGQQIVALLAADLGLVAPGLAWHTLRLPVADLAGALGTAAGVVGKVALDLVLLSATEVAEVSEGVAGRGGSSAMPHKRNPVAAVSARAGALRAPGLVATLLASMQQEHERAAGAWHAEWQSLSDLLRCAGSAAAWLRDGLEHLQVDAERMRDNIRAPATEALLGAVTGRVGRAAGQDVVRAVLAGDRSDPALAGLDVDALLDPAAATGDAGLLVDRALAGHAARHDRLRT